MKKILILASWCSGLGASVLIRNMRNDITLKNVSFLSDPWNNLYIPSTEFRILNRRFSRLFSLFRSYNFREFDLVIVMSDFPLRIKGAKQIVYFHNPHLLKSYKLKSLLFMILSRIRKCEFIVQSENIKKKLKMLSRNKIYVHRPPIDLTKIKINRNEKLPNEKYLYYPARDYPHKNITWLVKSLKVEELKLYVNLPRNRNLPEFVRAIGEKNYEENLKLIKDSKGIIIASTDETLCLPILEAKRLGIPLIVPREEYSIEQLAENEAYFYEPRNVESLNSTVHNFQKDLENKKCRIPQKLMNESWNDLLKSLINNI